MSTHTLTSVAALDWAPEPTARKRSRKSPWVVTLVRAVLLAVVVSQLALGLYSVLRNGAVSLQTELAAAAETPR